MKLTYAPKEAGKAYVYNKLWLPKSKVRAATVKKALEFTVSSQEGQKTIQLWKESKHHIICPREFLRSDQYSKYDFPFVDLRPTFDKKIFQDLVIPRNEEQRDAWGALSKFDNG